MALTQQRRFLRRLGEDEELREKLRAAIESDGERSFAEVSAVLREAGFSLTAEDLSALAEDLLGTERPGVASAPSPARSGSRLEGLSGVFHLPSLPSRDSRGS